jgi:hypothetical protein
VSCSTRTASRRGASRSGWCAQLASPHGIDPIAFIYGKGRCGTTVLAGSVRLVIQKEHNVPKEELLQFEGLVTEILPDARYRVQLDNGHQLVAYAAGRMKKNRI